MTSPDPQDTAEALDSDKILADTVELGEYEGSDIEPEYPPDRLTGSDDYGLTSAEEQIDEPLADQIARESPDPLVVALEHELDEQDAIAARSNQAGDDELDAEARESIDDRGSERTLLDDGTSESTRIDDPDGDWSVDEADTAQIGRLVDMDEDEDGQPIEDIEGDSIGRNVAGDDLSAEEEAMHLTSEPRFD